MYSCYYTLNKINHSTHTLAAISSLEEPDISRKVTTLILLSFCWAIYPLHSKLQTLDFPRLTFVEFSIAFGVYRELGQVYPAKLLYELMAKTADLARSRCVMFHAAAGAGVFPHSNINFHL